MDANALPLPGGDSPPPAPEAGELVVQNGRHAGTRRPLATPLTVIGRSPGCDVRLNVDAVQPLHCAIFQAPGGLVLRDLAGGTLVNDQPVTTCLLRDGDTLSVGPFQFGVRWEPPAVPEALPGTVTNHAELGALRVQAAAVAAQQAALFEEEERLQQRRAALEKQEEQLSAHLEERRLGLVAVQEEVRRDQAQLQQERGEFERERKARLEETARDRAEAARQREAAQRERRRLSELRRRLRRRWRRHWGGHEKALAGREQAVTREEGRLRAERATLWQDRLRTNGDAELGRRQIQDGWAELGAARREWQEQRRREEADLAGRRRELGERAGALGDAQRSFAAQQADARASRTNLDREIEGLENRVRNLRRKLADHEQDLARLGGAALPPPPPAAERPEPGHPLAPDAAEDKADPQNVAAARLLAELGALADVLADQRLQLAEQWQRFLVAQRAWHEDHAALFPQLEEAARRLEQRERQAVEQEERAAVAAGDLRERVQALARLRAELEGWQAHLTTAESTWRNERAALLAQVQSREALADQRQAMLEDVRGRWAVRRGEEFARLNGELRRCRDAHRRYLELLGECDRRRADLGAEERAQAEKRLALEQFQLELVGRSDNAAAAEKRIVKLRRQLAAAHAESERRLADRRRALECEADRLRAQAHHLHEQTETIAERESTLSARQSEWERQQLLAEQDRARQAEELSRLRQQGEVAARHRRELLDEVDRVVHVMLEDVDVLLPPPVRAA